MRALIIGKFISTRGYSTGPEKLTPIFQSLTQQTAPETWPRPPSSSLIVSPMYGIKEKMSVARNATQFQNGGLRLRLEPRHRSNGPRSA
jgi:hypothetical protein